MIAISASLIQRIRPDFSYLSASCPDVAENSTNGAMNTAPARLTSACGSRLVIVAAWNAAKMISAFLKMLSFAAPRNWVQKNGAKRRCRSRSNWLGGCMPGRWPARTARANVRMLRHRAARRRARLRSGRSRRPPARRPAAGRATMRRPCPHIPSRRAPVPRFPPDAPVPRFHAPRPRPRRGEAGPHRHRHAVGVRPSAALRPGGGLSAAHHQEGAHQVDRPRAAVVPARRDQRAPAAGRRRHHLGRMGRSAGRARPRLRVPVAKLAGARRPAHRPDGGGRRRDPAQPGFAPADRVGVERRRHPEDAAAAVPRVLPVLRGRREALLPALPAQLRHLPRRAVQHRVVRAAHPHGGAADAASRSAISSGPAATATCTSTTCSRSTEQLAREPFPLPRLVIHRKPDSLFEYRYEDFEFADYRCHPAIRAAVAV